MNHIFKDRLNDGKLIITDDKIIRSDAKGDIVKISEVSKRFADKSVEVCRTNRNYMEVK